MRFWYLSHCQALKAQVSLRLCADLPEPSLLVTQRIDFDKDSDQN